MLPEKKYNKFLCVKEFKNKIIRTGLHITLNCLERDDYFLENV